MPPRPGEASSRDFCLSVEKISRVGFRSRWSLGDGVRQLVEYVSTHGGL